MSRKSNLAAFHFSEDLPAFSSLAEAENTLLSFKDSTLEAFIAECGLTIGLDFSPESLKSLEKWYFEDEYPKPDTGSYSLASAIGFYFGEVLCRSAGYSWIVQEYVFRKGRYEIGVKRHLRTIMLTKGIIPPVQNNIRMQSLWRDYQKYAQ